MCDWGSRRDLVNEGRREVAAAFPCPTAPLPQTWLLTVLEAGGSIHHPALRQAQWNLTSSDLPSTRGFGVRRNETKAAESVKKVQIELINMD